MCMNNEGIRFIISDLAKNMEMNIVNVYDEKDDKELVFSEHWFIRLPEDQAASVHIGFWDDTNANLSADIAIKFCEMFAKANIKVFVDYDSTYPYWPALIY